MSSSVLPSSPGQFWEVEGLTLEPGQDESKLKPLAAQALGVSADALVDFELIRRSIDARKKNYPLLRYTVLTTLTDKTRVQPRPNAKRSAGKLPEIFVPKVQRDARVVVIGAGPAGLFAALRLAQAGLKPVVLERGKAVEPRAQDVQRFKRLRELNVESNFCYGEGGAGTWSDGKLTTRIGDERVRHVFETIVRLGGPKEILIDGKPHLGTNRLVKWLRAMRAELLALGATIRFETRAEKFVRDGQQIRGVVTHLGDTVDADHVVLAPGHSARSVFEWLAKDGIAMEAKSFAVGFRVEHPQALINQMQYGDKAPIDLLPAADYRLTDNLDIQGTPRGVYSFCMCPGGVIVPTATEEGGICINGMSHASRSSPWANSALVVSVDPKDFGWGGKEGVLAGIDFQRRAEQNAFKAGGSDFRAPAQRVGDFVAGKPTTEMQRSSFRPGTVPTSLDGLYPDYVTDALKIALGHWGKRMRGYVTNDATLIGVETRTSSPVRIVRDETIQSPSLRGLYPVAEGAGYAGGIVSAAVDGLRAADSILGQLG